MYWLVAMMSFALVATMGMGLYYEVFPQHRPQQPTRWFNRAMFANVALFAVGVAGVMFLGVQDVMAQTEAAGAAVISDGLGLALIGIGIPTGLAAIGAGIAVGPVGAASLGIISEKPEMFGRTLIYLGLAEGIAIYGLVVTILLLGKIG